MTANNRAYMRTYMRAHQSALTELRQRHSGEWPALLKAEQDKDPGPKGAPAHELHRWHQRVNQRARHRLAQLYRPEFNEIRKTKRQELEAEK